MPLRRRTSRCPALVLAVTISSAVAAAPPAVSRDEPVASARAELSVASIQVAPSHIFLRGLVTLRLKMTVPLAEDGRILWTSSAGYFLYDDLPEVHWRAPSSPGKVTLAVSVSQGGKTHRAQVEVEVKQASTKGMLWIPPGPFLRGDVEGTRDPYETKTVECANDEPFHEAYLDGYWIDRNLVTNRQYAEFLQAALKEGVVHVEDVTVLGEFDGEWVPYYYFRPYHLILIDFYKIHNARKPLHLFRISFDGKEFRIEPGRENDPVVDVSWYGAVAYARFHGKEIPTEAQWEKAARGVDGRRYPWGGNLATRYHAALDMKLVPVGSFSPLGDSPYGMSDLLAGCFEWTNDWFNPDYYGDYLARTPIRNPRGPFWGRSHTVRGFPGFVRYEVDEVNKSEPLCLRYEWFFEFVLGDMYADRVTGFRTVYCPPKEPLAP